MLFGNIAAFAGLLINCEFRAGWWPIATTHVALNLGLLAMETRLTPGRGRNAMWRRRVGAGVTILTAAGAVLGALVATEISLPIAAAASAAIALYAKLLFSRCAPSTRPTEAGRGDTR